MAKHKGDPADEQARAEDKKNEFDAMFEESTARADDKRERGEYPYDLDGIIRKS